MDILITTNIKTIEFQFNQPQNHWRIVVNNVPVCSWNQIISAYAPLKFTTLKLAVEFAKDSGFIPENFDYKELTKGKNFYFLLTFICFCGSIFPTIRREYQLPND